MKEKNTDEIKELSTEVKQEIINNKITPMISFIGILIGLLLNGYNTTDFKNFDETNTMSLKLFYIAATYCLIIAATMGLGAYKVDKNPLAFKTVTFNWLLMGLIQTTFVITQTIIAKVEYTFILLLSTVSLIVATDYLRRLIKKKHENKKNSNNRRNRNPNRFKY